ncbi:hypothetical protein D9V86_01870 [Bacteroidetes/Chlorobi group bacterium ChocPot_Mid]|nr:MAG: hypothetical protein D9V86_01870 [Bacteroidetes/Chlorobi group bacterium ChocPot_Mid]
MDFNFDSELLWDIWMHFIVYGTIVIFGLSLIRKFSLYANLKKQLGKNYKTIPDSTKMARWRKYLFVLMIFLSFLMLLTTLLRMESFLYLLPVLFVTCIVYLNGKLKTNYSDILSTFFYGDNGFCLYPGRNKIFSFSFYKWQNIEKVKIKESGSIREFKIKMKDKKGFITFRSKKANAENVKNIFKENNIVID